MLIKISRYLLLVLLASIFVFCAGTSMAQDECEAPKSCTNDKGWTVEMVGEGPVTLASSCVIQDADGVPQEVNPCYEWIYRVYSPDGDTKGLNHINFTIPVNCPEGTLIGEGLGATLHVYSPGEGDATTEFGKGILQTYIVKFTPNTYDGTWSFYSNTANIFKSSVGLKIGKSFSACEVVGPGSPVYALKAVGTSQDVTTADNKHFRIFEDPYTQCIKRVWELDGPGGNKIRELQQGLTGDVLKKKGIDSSGVEYEEDLEYFGMPGQGCARSIVHADGPNTWMFIAGRWYWF